MLYPEAPPWDVKKGYVIDTKFLKAIVDKLGDDAFLFSMAHVEMILIAMERVLDDPDQ